MDSESSYSRNTSQKSQWLLKTISDFDEKMEAVTAILEDSGSSDHKFHIYNRRPELIYMLKEISRSYHSLAQKYDQLRPKAHPVCLLGSLSSFDTTEVRYGHSDKGRFDSGDRKLDGFESPLLSLEEDPDIICEGTRINSGHRGKMKDKYNEPLLPELCNMNSKTELEIRDTQMHSGITEFSKKENDTMKTRLQIYSRNIYELGKMSPELKFQATKLAEDTLQHMKELVRRNDEKRETIKGLELQLEKLKQENRALQFSLRYSKADDKFKQSRFPQPSQISKGRFFGGCSS